MLKKHLRIADNVNNTVENKRFEQLQTSLKRNEQKKFPDSELSPLEFEIDKFNKVTFGIDNLIFVEALGNYINISYCHKENRKITIRETLSNIEQKIGTSKLIYKPHRSYLVNLQNIKNVTGHSQGLKIHLKDSDKIIPVSRNKIKEFRTLVTEII